MTRLRPSKPRDVIRKLRRAGFEVDHVAGSHYVLRHSDGRRTVVPYHAGKDIKRDTLRSILSQAGLTIDEYLEL